MLFLLAAFVAGGAVGFATARVTTPTAQAAAQAAAELSPREALARELQLTPEQRVVVDSAWDWRRQQSREIMKQVQPALDSVRDSARVLIMKPLTSAQQDLFRQLIERNQRVADSLAKARGATR